MRRLSTAGGARTREQPSRLGPARPAARPAASLGVWLGWACGWAGVVVGLGLWLGWGCGWAAAAYPQAAVHVRGAVGLALEQVAAVEAPLELAVRAEVEHRVVHLAGLAAPVSATSWAEARTSRLGCVHRKAS